MDEEASELAGKYVTAFLPGLFMAGMLDIDRGFLASFGKSDVAMKSQMISPVLHIIVCYTLTIKAGLGIVGCGLSGTITNSIILLI